jgi:aminoglycoside 3-N-acetyltransferase
MDEMCAMFLDAIVARIGADGVLAVPTFTYSFPRKEVFDLAETPSGMGGFAEWIRRHPDSRRSEDPCFSIAAIGGRAGAFTDDAAENSFGPGSFFDRFHKAGGKILNFNFDAGSTYVHYVERELGVPYRFDKTFHGILRRDGRDKEARSTIWVRYLSDDALEAVFEPLDALARARGMFRTVRLGRGAIGLISAADTFRLIADTLPDRPLFLTRAEALGITTPNIVPEVPTEAESVS